VGERNTIIQLKILLPVLYIREFFFLDSLDF
jgi:hypothetical protein